MPHRWRAVDLEAGPEATLFRVLREGREAARVRLPMFGRFNVENALAALATVEALGVPLAEAVEALATFRGVKRRQEILGEARGVVVGASSVATSAPGAPAATSICAAAIQIIQARPRDIGSENRPAPCVILSTSLH